MKSKTCAATAALAMILWAYGVHAAGTLFGFYVEHEGEYYWVQLAGREDPGAIEFRWPGFPEGVLQGQKVDLEFDRSTQRMEMRYVNPGDPTRPPSFRISIKGETGFLEFDGRKLPGTVDWTNTY